MSPENLWGDIPLNVGIVTPVSILREQAAALKDATKETLIGRVVQFGSGTDSMQYGLRIIAPLVGNYQYEVCQIHHDIALYPVFLADSTTGSGHKCANEKELKDGLAQIFKQDRVRQVIQSLIAQSRK